MHQILIVEDNLQTQKMYEAALAHAGYFISLASNGQEGLTLFERDEYDIVILDLMLPIIDGLELLRILQDKHITHKNGPIIVLTNLRQEPIIREALRLGATKCVEKSDLLPKQLVTIINQTLNQIPSPSITASPLAQTLS